MCADPSWCRLFIFFPATKLARFSEAAATLKAGFLHLLVLIGLQLKTILCTTARLGWHVPVPCSHGVAPFYLTMFQALRPPSFCPPVVHGPGRVVSSSVSVTSAQTLLSPIGSPVLLLTTPPCQVPSATSSPSASLWTHPDIGAFIILDDNPSKNFHSRNLFLHSGALPSLLGRYPCPPLADEPWTLAEVSGQDLQPLSTCDIAHAKPGFQALSTGLPTNLCVSSTELLWLAPPKVTVGTQCHHQTLCCLLPHHSALAVPLSLVHVRGDVVPSLALCKTPTQAC